MLYFCSSCDWAGEDSARQEHYKFFPNHHFKESDPFHQSGLFSFDFSKSLFNLNDYCQQNQKVVSDLRNGKCLNIIPNTFIICGEALNPIDPESQFNFCSALCQIKHLLNREIKDWEHIDSGFQALSAFKEKMMEILKHD